MNIKKIILIGIVAVVVISCLNVACAGWFDWSQDYKNESSEVDYKPIDEDSIIVCNVSLADSTYSFAYSGTEKSTDYAYYYLNTDDYAGDAYYYYTQSSGKIKVNLSEVVYEEGYTKFNPDEAQKYIDENFTSDLKEALDEGQVRGWVDGDTIDLGEAYDVSLDGDIMTFKFNGTKDIKYTSDKKFPKKFGDIEEFDFFIDVCPEGKTSYSLGFPLDVDVSKLK